MAELTEEQEKLFDENRQPALYASLIVFLVINNFAVIARCFSHYRSHYKTRGTIFIEDVFIVLGGLLINAILANLLASTHFGLGLHAFKITHEDPQIAVNISKTFRHVWICMVLFSPTFTSIKLALLFFYRRVFLVHQKWLKIAWWANLVYLLLWVFGSTGFYLFQCWPVSWYWMRYYGRFKVETPGGMKGQCDATTVEHVAMPVIFSLISDVATLLLPITAIMKLQIDMKRKLAIAGVFSVGALACLLGLARLVELEVDTDDKTDPSYGVVIFLILSAGEAVCAIVCASAPVVGPQAFKEYKAHQHSHKRSTTGTSSKLNTASSGISKGFHKLGGESGDLDSDDQAHILPPDQVRDTPHAIPLNSVNVERTEERVGQKQRLGDDQIVVKSEVHVTRDKEQEAFEKGEMGKAL